MSAVFFMPELKLFYNHGSGWVCRKCDGELAKPPDSASGLSRAFREGEAESKTPTFANPALAKWADTKRTSLICPRCGATEAVTE